MENGGWQQSSRGEVWVNVVCEVKLRLTAVKGQGLVLNPDGVNGVDSVWCSVWSVFLCSCGKKHERA